MSRPAAILLAGGRSRRFGRDKAQTLVGEQTMLERVVAAASGLAEPVLVVGGQGPCPAPARQVADREPGGGPVQAVTSALEQAPGRDWLLLACDLPYLSARDLAWLAQPLPAGSQVRIVFLCGRPQYLASFWRAPCAVLFAAACSAGQRSLRAVVEQAEVAPATESDLHAAGLDPSSFLDVDTPDALRDHPQTGGDGPPGSVQIG